MVKSLTAFVLALATLVLIPASTVLAADSGSVGGKPANPKADNPRSKSIFIYDLKAGQSASDGVRVVNTGSKAKSVHLYPVDGLLASGGSFSCKQEVEDRADVGAWIKLQSEHITVPGNSDVVVPFNVTLPSRVDVGEHDGCIAIQEEGQKSSTSGNGVALTFRTAIRVAVTVPGKITKSLQFESIKTGSAEGGNVVITPTIRNTGNVSLDTRLKSELTPILGVRTSQDNGSYPILPRSKASWNLELKRPFWGGLYKAKVSATYSTYPTSGLGVSKGAMKTISSTSGLLFVAPAPAALGIELLILALVAAGIAYLLRRRMHHRQVRRHWQSYTVKDGDTINKVAHRFDVSWKRLAKANKLRAPYTLESGRQLRVPPTENIKE
jgi:hypothetical protein